MSNLERKYAPDFRRDETAYVMERWLATQSCALVGIGSVGKSNLLRHLASAKTQAHYLGDALGTSFRAITIDPNMLGSLPDAGIASDSTRAWAGYELMMHRLFLAFYPFEQLSKDEAHRFYEVYESIQDGTNPLYAYMSLRHFELALDLLFRQGARIVFMFDEFEEMMRMMPVKFFQNLRGLRDSYKSQMAYLTFTRAPLDTVSAQLGIPDADIESFNELFTDNTYFVGPYNEADAARMLAELAMRTGKTLAHDTAQTLLATTGGYAGLLRSSFSLIEPGVLLTPTLDNIHKTASYLSLRLPIRTECRTIWLSLTQAEQYVLRAVARLAAYDVNVDTQVAVNQLIQKRLLRLDKASNQLFIHPPVFSVYVSEHRDEV